MGSSNQALKASNEPSSIAKNLCTSSKAKLQVEQDMSQMLAIEMESFYLYTSIEMFLYQKG